VRAEIFGPVYVAYRISGSWKASSGLRKIDWSYQVDEDNFTAVFESKIISFCHIQTAGDFYR
jgi:hypothetical protein